VQVESVYSRQLAAGHSETIRAPCARMSTSASEAAPWPAGSRLDGFSRDTVKAVEEVHDFDVGEPRQAAHR
jgi:hypothetical protein